ncbi:acetolactate synthase small subunit 1, chloroplastic-like [Lactuca sativa]|uniref:acetolactate synthase small subunit 1, chloroplastic-like n=1 Tax=Lactuca sativa TaxID=4236 RepID=UPI001C68AC6A|nr:acetolactate synthase small subunit 1, chloroplastic-like [Lactuca sativa]
MMSRIFRMNISKRIMLHYSRGKKNKNKAPKRNKISFRKEKLMSQISNQRDHRNIEGEMCLKCPYSHNTLTHTYTHTNCVCCKLLIALRREKLGESAPFWNFCAACYQDLEAPTPIPTTSSVTHMVDENFSVVSGGDVYHVEYYDRFSMNQVLDPHWGVLYEEESTGHKSHTVNILVNNAPGVLNLVTGVISRTGYDVPSLAAGPAEMEGLAWITIVIPVTDESCSVKLFFFFLMKKSCKRCTRSCGSTQGTF